MTVAGVRLLLLVLVITGYQEVVARAIMVEPPHRSSLWRFNFNTSVNLRDDSLNCGGYDWQWGVHQGRCGVCGDRWNGTQDNADGGRFDSGIVARQYKEGHYINITFEVSSNYLGYVEFRLCPRNTTVRGLDQSCFDRYPLWIDESHGTRYYIGSRGGIYDLHIRLPAGLLCRRCVLQWKYKTGYRYNGEDSCKCLGCGRQEQYVNCADIEISPRDGWSTGDVKGRTTSTHIGQQQSGQVGRLNGVHVHIGHQTTRPAFNGATRPPVTSSVANTSPAISPMDVLVKTTTSTAAASEHPSKSVTSVTTAVTSPVIKPTQQSHTDSGVKQTPSPETIEAIRREIIKRLGNGVTRDVRVPQRTVPPVVRPGRIFRRPIVSAVSERPPTIRQRNGNLPNTQFVSVSSILNRFFLLSSSLNLPPGCDVTSDEFRCVARGIYNQSPGISKWCEINCRASNCVSFMCECHCEDKRGSRSKSQNSSCHAIADFKGVVGMDQWCTANCKVGYCPANTCSVEDCLSRPDVHSNGEL